MINQNIYISYCAIQGAKESTAFVAIAGIFYDDTLPILKQL